MGRESASRARGWAWGVLSVVLWACGPVPEQEPAPALELSTARVVASCGATCSEGYQYALHCHALRSSSECPLLGYEQTTCHTYHTCAHPAFGLLSQAGRTEAVPLTGSYRRVLKCESNQAKEEEEAQAAGIRPPPYFCYWENEYSYDQTCEQRAQALRAMLPAAWQSGVTYSYREGAPQHTGASTFVASCTIAFANWPTFRTAAGPQCGVASSYVCDDRSRPRYQACRHASHGLAPAAECGPEVRTTAPGLTLAQAHAEAARVWAELQGQGPVPFRVAPVCSDCSALLPTESQGGETPGRLEGTSSVTADGAATYTLPLWVPEGRAGIQPELSLRYHSRGGNGPLGMGWSLGGLSRMTRCPRTYPRPAQLHRQ